MSGEYFTYASGIDGKEIRSYFVAPPKAAGAVILLRGVAGPDSGYTEIADRLAQEGFAGLVHTWQVRGNDLDDATLVGDLASAIKFVQQREPAAAKNLAVFGYCKGGGFAVLAAARLPEIRAVVAFHGFARRPEGGSETARNPIDVVDAVKIPVLLLHGECDQLSPIAGMRELEGAFKRAGKSASLHVYPAADHGFAVSTHKGFRAEDASDGFRRAVEFLRSTFGARA
jgi:carboxymethylenebutenolidase